MPTDERIELLDAYDAIESAARRTKSTSEEAWRSTGFEGYKQDAEHIGRILDRYAVRLREAIAKGARDAD